MTKEQTNNFKRIKKALGKKNVFILNYLPPDTLMKIEESGLETDKWIKILCQRA